MNKIASFRLCKLSDTELIEKIDTLTDKIFIDQQVPTRHIPARPDEDYDLLVGELLLRFKEGVESEKGIKCHKELIICPECKSEENATVEHSYPWWTYLHKCSKCNYMIMESDWNKKDPGEGIESESEMEESK